ncbi:lysophospholipid acyltransferase family protein [Planctobacterium marinum]|uniref:L-ornithine N(alpha)-acyltransferase n=1 Tax=Planctobacterium marinum TaxID=1631968 RepID=A0AA48HJY6_9ALTE|nr:hemolysin [Planctobacterium marinum]
MTSQISLASLLPPEKQKTHITLPIRLIDKIMGLAKMQRLYEANNMQGLAKEEFADKLLSVLNVTIEGEQELLSKVPKTGPVVIASNHPFGGLEGVILARLLGKVRQDIKVLANVGLQIFSELQDYFIFTNPLSERDPRNGPSLRTSMAHVKAGGALLLFPSGKVSYKERQQNRVVEHPWNRLVAKLVQSSQAQFLPVWVEGQNSDMFYRIESIYYPLRMLFLGRELLNKTNAIVKLNTGNSLAAKYLVAQQAGQEQADLARCLSVACTDEWRHDWPKLNTANFSSLAEPVDKATILTEIANLPAEQHLVTYKQFDVYYGFQSQLPQVVNEIARLRELVFRQHDEGSGEPRDTDKFDATYTQLFIVNREEGQIIGAYRMGQTDKLLQQNGVASLYLSQMFEFDTGFYNQQEPCLEMGRSFLIPEYQRSYYGLYLLWRGIGAFVCKFPQYRRLYGTVSISKLYDKRSIALMEKALVRPLSTVRARTPWNIPLQPDLQAFAQQYDLAEHLTSFLKTLEADGKDIPVLLKHYQKLGAEFYCLGLDSNFADTPGLLLCVDLLNMPEKLGKQYLAEGWQSYKEYHQQ